MEVECTTKKWGSSIGIIIPKELAEKENIGENEKIIVSVKKKIVVKDVFGKFKDWKTPTQQLKDEMKKGWK